MFVRRRSKPVIKWLDNTITIDPGWNTGVAKWHDTKVPELITLTTRYKDGSAFTKLRDMLNRFDFQATGWRVDGIKTMYIEGVQYFTGSKVGMAAAGRGDLSYLAYLVGGYVQIAMFHGINVLPPLNPSTWKGQLTLKAIQNLVHRVNNIHCPNEHTYHAVAMGDLLCHADRVL